MSLYTLDTRSTLLFVFIECLAAMLVYVLIRILSYLPFFSKGSTAKIVSLLPIYASMFEVSDDALHSVGLNADDLILLVTFKFKTWSKISNIASLFNPIAYNISFENQTPNVNECDTVAVLDQEGNPVFNCKRGKSLNLVYVYKINIDDMIQFKLEFPNDKYFIESGIYKPQFLNND